VVVDAAGGAGRGQVFRFHGPWYGWTAAVGQYAQVIMSKTPIRPKYGTRWSSLSPSALYTDSERGT
jgi:hypothetical protein